MALVTTCLAYEYANRVKDEGKNAQKNFFHGKRVL